jgi:hypothetical protein
MLRTLNQHVIVSREHPADLHGLVVCSRVKSSGYFPLDTLVFFHKCQEVPKVVADMFEIAEPAEGETPVTVCLVETKDVWAEYETDSKVILKADADDMIRVLNAQKNNGRVN